MEQHDQSQEPFDPRRALQGFLVLDALARLFIWGHAVAGASAIFTYLNAWPSRSIIGAGFRSAWIWAVLISLWIMLFNVLYVMLLALLRLTIPTPKEGRYVIVHDAPIDRQLKYACILAILTKARYEPPFPGFLVFQFANIPPMVWIMGRVFGPKSRSCSVTETTMLDPHLIEVGRNVTFGFGVIVSAHTQARDEIIIKKTRIEDDVLIGGNVIVYSGCTVQRGAVVLGGAIVQPDTNIGPYEIWGGVPARKIKDGSPG